MATTVLSNIPPAGDAPPDDGHEGGGFVRIEGLNAPWNDDVNASCHGIFNLKFINCIPLSDFLTTPLQVNVDAGGHTIFNVGKLLVGSSSDDGSGALLQVGGEINAKSYMVGGKEFVTYSSGDIILDGISSINGNPLTDFKPSGSDGSVQFNDDGNFAGDSYFIYNELNHSLIVGLQQPSTPVWKFEVGGDINIVDPSYFPFAYRINGIPFATASSSGIVLSNIFTINGSPPGGGGGGGAVNSVFTRQGDVVAQTGDYTAAQVTNAVDSTVGYSDPAWITSLAWSKITGAPAPGGGTPAAPVNSVQWNNNGAFGGSANLIWNNSLFILGVGNSATVIPDANATNTHAIVGPTTTGTLYGEITACGASTTNNAVFCSVNFANYARSAAEKRMGVIQGILTSSGSNYGGLLFKAMYNQTLDPVGISMSPGGGGTSLGIGTAFAGYAIDVRRSSGPAAISCQTDSGNNYFSTVQGTSYVGSGINNPVGLLVRGLSARGSAATPTVTQTNDQMLTLEAQGYYGPSAFIRSASVQMIAEGNWSTTSIPSAITFFTTPTSSLVPVERTRITNGGNVGIGTTTPVYKLDVAGDCNLSSGSAYRINGVSIAAPINYTAAEQDTKVTWTDGKKVYQKSLVDLFFDDAMNPNTFAHGITNISQIVGVDGFLQDAGGKFFPLSYLYPLSTNSIGFGMYVDMSNINLWSSPAFPNGFVLPGTAWVTIRYTCTNR